MRSYREVAGNVPAAVPVFRFEADPKGRSWALLDRYCDNPRCDTGEVQVTFLSQEEKPEQIRFELDRRAGRITWLDHAGETQQAITVEFCADPRVLRMLDRRRQLVRATGLLEGRRRRYDPGQTYAFEDFAPARRSLGAGGRGGEQFAMQFEVDGAGWLASDAYCVNPDCGCEEAVVSFFRILKEREVQKVEFALRLELADGGRARPADGATSLSTTQKLVLECFKTDLAHWREELTRRRDLLRRIASSRLKFQEPAPSVEPTPPARVVTVGAARHVGRNAPCPCGSGHKFKKCCGR